MSLSSTRRTRMAADPDGVATVPERQATPFVMFVRLNAGVGALRPVRELRFEIVLELALRDRVIEAQELGPNLDDFPWCRDFATRATIRGPTAWRLAG